MSQANDGQNLSPEAQVAQVCSYRTWKNMEPNHQSVLTMRSPM